MTDDGRRKEDDGRLTLDAKGLRIEDGGREAGARCQPHR